MLIKNVMIWVSSVGSLTVSTTVPNCHAFVWLCVGTVLKLSFKEDADTLQMFAGSFWQVWQEKVKMLISEFSNWVIKAVIVNKEKSMKA